MEPTKAKMGSPEVRTAGDTIVFILTSWNIKPGILLAIHNGAVVYDGEAALAPKEVMSKPGVIAIMHVHDKQRLDAALNKAARLDKRKGPLPQNLVEAQVALNKPAFHPSQLPGLLDHLDASDPSALEGRGLQPKDAMEYHAGNRTDDPDLRYGADDQGKAGWGNKND